MAERKSYERAGRLIYGMQRICGGSEGLCALAANGEVDADAALRGEAIALRYDALCARFVSDADGVTDGEVEALLADARALEEEMVRQYGAGWVGRRG